MTYEPDSNEAEAVRVGRASLQELVAMVEACDRDEEVPYHLFQRAARWLVANPHHALAPRMRAALLGEDAP